MASLAIPDKNLVPNGIDFHPRALHTWLDALPPKQPVQAAAD